MEVDDFTDLTSEDFDHVMVESDIPKNANQELNIISPATFRKTSTLPSLRPSGTRGTE